MVDGVEEIFGFASKSPKRAVIKVKKRAPEEPSMQDRIKTLRKKYKDQSQNPRPDGKLKYRKPVSASEGIMTGSVSTTPITPPQSAAAISKSKDREQRIKSGANVGGRTVKKDADVRRVGGVTRSKRLTSNAKFSVKRSTLNKDKEIKTQLRARPTSPNMFKR
jgi:hypothetical protein